MKKLIILCTCLFSTSVISSEIFLEGISILGNKKSAFISIDGNTITAKEGDLVADLTIERIEPKLLYLRSSKGELSELGLHSTVVSTPSVAPIPKNTNPFAEALKAKENNLDNPTEEKPKTQTFKPRRIADEDVPEDKRRVRTPFGDVLIDKKSEDQNTNNSNPPTIIK
jgi:hypothetical protein